MLHGVAIKPKQPDRSFTVKGSGPIGEKSRGKTEIPSAIESLVGAALPIHSR